MKKRVLLLCGSPHAEGCTRRALREVEAALEQAGVETETFCIGAGPVRGCVACGGCGRAGRCVFADEAYDRLTAMLERADGLVVGSPVYYAGPNGSLCALLDRVFYSAGDLLRGKPPARWSTAAGRRQRRLRPAQQVLHHRPDAGGTLRLLEFHPRLYAGGGGTGPGGAAGYACFRPEYGRHAGPACAPGYRGRKPGGHQLYPVTP